MGPPGSEEEEEGEWGEEQLRGLPLLLPFFPLPILGTHFCCLGGLREAMLHGGDGEGGGHAFTSAFAYTEKDSPINVCLIFCDRKRNGVPQSSFANQSPFSFLSSANPSFPILKKWAMLRATIVFQSAVSAAAGAPIHHRRRRRPFQPCIEAAAVLFGGPPHA